MGPTYWYEACVWAHAVWTQNGCWHLLQKSGARHFVTPCRLLGRPNHAALDSCGDDKYWGSHNTLPSNAMPISNKESYILNTVINAQIKQTRNTSKNKPQQMLYTMNHIALGVSYVSCSEEMWLPGDRAPTLQPRSGTQWLLPLLQTKERSSG